MARRTVMYSFLTTILLLIGISIQAQQNMEVKPSPSSAVLRIDYCTNWLVISYGNDMKKEFPLERDKRATIKDQVASINNALVNQLNNLNKEGYTVVSSTDDSINGTTCGITFVLYKKE